MPDSCNGEKTSLPSVSDNSLLSSLAASSPAEVESANALPAVDLDSFCWIVIIVILRDVVRCGSQAAAVPLAFSTLALIA